MSRHYATELSRPVDVRWGPWVSNTYDLQRAGWEIVADEDFERFAMRVMIRDPRSGMVGYTMVDRGNFAELGMMNQGRLDSPHHSHMSATEYRMRYEGRWGGRSLEFQLLHDSMQVRYAEPPVYWGDMTRDMDRYKPVDATPRVVDMASLLHEYQVFATMDVVEDENQIFAEPETVADLLDKIKKIQLPEQEQIRARMKAREKREGGVIIKPSAQLQAQILSFTG